MRSSQPAAARSKPAFDAGLRLYIYRYFIREGKAPSAAQMAEGTSRPLRQVKAALERLSQTHAFVRQENGELWRAAPFSAVPTAFPVKIGLRSLYGNCIWDALGIPAMLHKDARIDASCACCNFEMVLNVKDGQLLRHEGIGHFAVPACQWYQDIAFT
jgi:alkylmercury lyase-like protein